jgi:hypothetical protein
MIVKLRFAVLAAFAIIFVMAALPASSTTWDATAEFPSDWATATNPYGQWSCGSYDHLGGT